MSGLFFGALNPLEPFDIYLSYEEALIHCFRAYVYPNQKPVPAKTGFRLSDDALETRVMLKD